MAGRIPDTFIDALNDRLNLVDVVGARVPLKKAGREYTGRCPFHDDSSPSFAVNPDKQVYHCFGCGASGGLISFVMEFDRVDFISAVESLASLAGLEIPRTADDPEAESRRGLYQVLEDADRLFRSALKSHPDRERAVTYLKSRGLTGQIAHQFGLGFAPPGWRFVFDALGTDKAQQKVLLEAGLTTQNPQGREYDRFRDRVMFPIRDIRGRTIAFGGRVLDDSKPKYLNSPETKLFHKSDTLYGLYEARQANRSLDRVLVVEGYMDVVALAQFGIPFAVATLGTALTGSHLDRLSRQTSQVIVCFDGDKAGRIAAKRAMDTMLGFLSDAFSIRFLFLPEGHDPDSLVRDEGTDGFLNRLNDALPASEALIRLLAEEIDLTKIDGRARLTALALPKIAQVPQSIYRSLMLDQLAELSGTRRSDLDARMADLPAIQPPPALSPRIEKPTEIEPEAQDAPPQMDAELDHYADWHREQVASEDPEAVMAEPPLDALTETPPQALVMPNPDRPEPLINRILWMILQAPEATPELPPIPLGSQLTNGSALEAVRLYLTDAKPGSTAALMGHFSGTEIGRLLSRLLKREALVTTADIAQELRDGIVQLKRQLVTESMRQMAQDVRLGRLSAEDLNEALAAHKK